MKLNLHQVKSQFSKYIDLVESGETVIVCKRNVPVAEIRPIPRKDKKQPKLGWAEGRAKMPADFNQMSQTELAQWEGDVNDPLLKYAPRKRKGRK
jgi:antitoxin (DNA-binding transcriptional repressor) of toxin-antitoxin stability system